MVNPNQGTTGTKEIHKLNIPEGIGDIQNLIHESSTVLTKDSVLLEM